MGPGARSVVLWPGTSLRRLVGRATLGSRFVANGRRDPGLTLVDGTKPKSVMAAWTLARVVSATMPGPVEHVGHGARGNARSVGNVDEWGLPGVRTARPLSLLPPWKTCVKPWHGQGLGWVRLRWSWRRFVEPFG